MTVIFFCIQYNPDLLVLFLECFEQIKNLLLNKLINAIPNASLWAIVLALVSKLRIKGEYLLIILITE